MSLFSKKSGSIPKVRAWLRTRLSAVSADSYDLVISDIGLPDGSGLDLMRQIIARNPIRRIALSGFGMDEDVRRSKAAGFHSHLTKPVNIDRLEATVRQLTTHCADAGPTSSSTDSAPARTR
jgi:DNA-binding response OmpR family regulator